MQEVKDILFCPNGLVSAFDMRGEGIPEINTKGWMELYFEFLEGKGYDPTKIWIESQLNGGQWKRVIPIKTEHGWVADFGEAKKLKETL